MIARRLPIRWRLTVWYAAILGVTLATFGALLYVGLRTELSGDLDEQLRRQAEFALAAVEVRDGELALEREAVASLRDDDHFVRLLAADGRVVADTTADVGGVPLAPDLVSAALAGRARFGSYDTGDDLFRVVTSPVWTEGDVVGVLQVGAEQGDVAEFLAELRLLLLVATPLVLLVAAAGGYVLAGRALAPVSTITDLAARIRGQDLRARLNLDLPDDELGRLARTFDGMLARIEEAFERQRRFTGDAAHELRTPLSLMRSQVDLALARPRSPEEYREALRGLDGDLARLTGLVGTLLTLARSDAGRLVPDRTSFDLADTVGLVLEQYSPAAEEADVTLKDESSSAPVVADEDLLVQVLVNLLDNALAHTPPGGTIVVGCRPEDGGARLWVADTGAGIAAEDRERVFDRFYRGDTGRTRDAGGTGLGLTIAKAIAEAHGGTIALASQAGPGTRVELVLPAAP